MQNFFLFTVIQYVKDHSKARHRYEVKIQKDTKRYDLRTCASAIVFQKDIYTTKKRDCNLAVPHIEALVLPFVTNSNTVAHAIYIYNKVRVYTYAYE